MKTLIYVPLEKYKERYTEYLSGMDGTFVKQAAAALKGTGAKIDILQPSDEVNEIKTGIVLDTVRRCEWSFHQMCDLVKMIFDEGIDSSDVIYFEDFWHPGMEMLPYALSLVYGPRNFWPQIYGFCHAQSVDPHDFTHMMKWWMRGFEISWAHVLDGIFTAAPEMCDMLVEGKVAPANKCHATGTVFSANVIRRIAGCPIFPIFPHKDRVKRVVWSSRFDAEKNPMFFLNMAQAVLRERSDVHFVICTGAKELNGQPDAVQMAQGLARSYPLRFKIATGLTKEVYYQYLAESRVQFNCADQDFVSYTLLEAAAMGCLPLYPNYLTFPAALNYQSRHLYVKNSESDAVRKLYELLDNDWSTDLYWIYSKYEYSVQRMLAVMGFNVKPMPTLQQTLDAFKPPVGVIRG